MFSSKAFRTAGLVALCLFVGLALSGAWSGAQQPPLPPLQIIVKGDSAFGPIADQLGRILVDCRCCIDGTCPQACSLPECRGLLGDSRAVEECGTIIAEIIIDPEARKIQDPAAAARSLDDGPILIGGVRSLNDSNHFLGTATSLPKGDYFIWMAEAGKLGIRPIWPWPSPPPLPDEIWFTFMAFKKPDSTFDLKAIFYYADGKFRTPEQWLLSLTPRNSIPSIGRSSTIPDSIWSQCCDLTVRQLSVTARRIIIPDPIRPYVYWDIFALATVANIGDTDLKEPFTVRILLNGRLIHEEEITELAAGAQQIILASETVYTPGLYTVTVIVDPDNKIIKERDETNNIAERSINIQ